MAGSEQTGVEAARADLFEKAQMDFDADRTHEHRSCHRFERDYRANGGRR